jgi:hypothetical protein
MSEIMPIFTYNLKQIQMKRKIENIAMNLASLFTVALGGSVLLAIGFAVVKLCMGEVPSTVTFGY